MRLKDQMQDYQELPTGSQTTKAVFRCQVCLSVAATIKLTIPPGAQHGQLELDGFLWKHSTEVVKGRLVQAVQQALSTHDAELLHKLYRMWAPFYCPQCQRVYCVRHWHITPHFDHDLPGWYDSAHGVCPKGHRRLVDD
jgi:hypothetical protein